MIAETGLTRNQHRPCTLLCIKKKLRAFPTVKFTFLNPEQLLYIDFEFFISISTFKISTVKVCYLEETESLPCDVFVVSCLDT